LLIAQSSRTLGFHLLAPLGASFGGDNFMDAVFYVFRTATDRPQLIKPRAANMIRIAEFFWRELSALRSVHRFEAPLAPMAGSPDRKN